ncbi:50S ribosomal protein L30 [Marinithermus hydrothermalis]|uniref:Large ribosomal subunit protein uL30 n=1 Tax=Marinithermus hydrothermalis (strain DSM 14884 / JCM 11576 / T1) TaxID=869210 RepID=F2NMQ9_MARHT|nr:50S ribosomal protein L30 [Marinithermus hydrothermalis]AEB12443.1 ribosomal protein L30 [Marinithermus hydrothermalis DSM 14884]
MGTIRVKLVKSPIGYAKDQKATLRALKLTKLNRERELPDNPAIRGMIRKVQHLVKIVEVKE